MLQLLKKIVNVSKRVTTLVIMVFIAGVLRGESNVSDIELKTILFMIGVACFHILTLAFYQLFVGIGKINVYVIDMVTFISLSFRVLKKHWELRNASIEEKIEDYLEDQYHSIDVREYVRNLLTTLWLYTALTSSLLLVIRCLFQNY